MEMAENHPPSPSETTIQDLPDECLSEIFHYVGSPRLPICRTAGNISSNSGVRHPLQCTLVCKQWRTAAAAAVRSLTLDVSRITLSNGDAQDLGLRLCNLKALTLRRRGDHIFHRDPFINIEHLVLRVQSLSVLFPIHSITIPSFIRILTMCHCLQNLTVDFTRVPCLTSPRVVALLDALCEIPLLKKLRLRCQSPCDAAHSIIARLGKMGRMQEVHLRSNVIPPMESTGKLRSLDWTCGWQASVHSMLDSMLWHLTGLEALTLRQALITELPESIGCLTRVTSLKVKGMGCLLSLPPSLSRLSSLRVLSVTDCLALETLPETLGELQRLRTLRVDCCRMLPESIGKLSKLETLHIKGHLVLPDQFGQLKCLPEGIGHLTCLRSLRLVSCRSLYDLPECLGNLVSLETLEIGYCPVKSLPESLSQLTHLKSCTLALPEIQSLPKGIGSWRRLQKFVVKCRAVPFLPNCIWQLVNLQQLTLKRCHQLTTLSEGIGNLSALTHLKLIQCLKLRTMPDDLGKLSSLEFLSFSHCGHLTRLPWSLRGLSALRELCLTMCRSLEDLPEGVQHLPRLRVLRCPSSLLRVDKDVSRVWVDSGLDEPNVSDSNYELDSASDDEGPGL